MRKFREEYMKLCFESQKETEKDGAGEENKQLLEYLKNFESDDTTNFLNKERVLELGCGFGFSSIEIAKHSKELIIVDIEKTFIERLKGKIKAKFIIDDWFNFKDKDKFSDIVLFRGIDYVKDPDKLLNHIKTLMKKDAKLHILVPNNKSIHRLVAFYANLDNPFELTQNDYNVGHLKSYNLEILIYLLQKNGFEIIYQEGIGLKPLSNAQMDKLDDKILDAFVKMGNISIQNAAEIYLICKVKHENRKI